MAPPTQVVVVGAGIIGASISRQLARRGAQVTVLEAAPAPAAGATGKSWAWLNANAKQPQHYRDLNLRSMQLWQRDHAGLATFCGCLMLHDERPDADDPSYPSAHVPAGPQLQACEPGLSPGLAAGCQHARLYAAEGWCDPVEATQQLLSEAQAAGARVLFSHTAEAVTLRDGRATGVTCSATQPSSSTAPPVQEGQERQHVAADVVVLAAGVGASALAAQLGCDLPLLHKPAAIVLTQPLRPGILQRMLVTDSVFMLQRKDGRFLIGETAPTAASNTDTSKGNAGRILQLAAAAVPALASGCVQGMHVGFRPYPADGYPVLGFLSSCPNAYVAVTHSGMTLAPLIGELAADEIMPGSSGSSEAAELLQPYRPDRDFEAAAAARGSGLNWASTLKK